MRVAVIFTGGTIGSKVKDGWIGSDDSACFELINGYDNPGDITFESFSPYTVLSENLSATELNHLLAELEDKLNKDYSGIIVTHGTDTLQYSAAAAELAFGGCRIPVIFVSAAYPLEDERTNGYANFNAAVEFIRKVKTGGVYISYKNENSDEAYIHIPSEVVCHREWDSDVYSYKKPFASFDGAEFKITAKDIRKGHGICKYKKNSGVFVISSQPGDSFSYSLTDIDAVILKPYHSSTVNTAGEEFKAFMKKCRENKIPVYMPDANTGITYESLKDLPGLGIIPVSEPFPYLYMRLWRKAAD